MVLSLLEDISYWQVISDRSGSLRGRDFSQGNFSPADGPSQKKGKKAFAPNTQIHRPCCVTGSLSRPHTGQQWGYRHVQDSWERRNNALAENVNYAAETKQALTGMPSEAPTKHILNGKAIPASHWEFRLDKHHLPTVMGRIYRQQERRLKDGKWKDGKITRKQKAEHWKGGGEDLDKKNLAGTERERERESAREGDGRGRTGSVKSFGDLSG